jgi:hypothetical protein
LRLAAGRPGHPREAGVLVMDEIRRPMLIAEADADGTRVVRAV